MVYGLDDKDAFLPWVVTQKIAELAVEFRKCKAIKVLYWHEYLLPAKEYPSICSRISSYEE